MAGMRRDVACHPAVTQANQFAYYHNGNDAAPSLQTRT
jgi:hypothetical protein